VISVSKKETNIAGALLLVLYSISDQDMLLYRKSRLWGCYKLRDVTKRDMLLLATLRYFILPLFFVPKLRSVAQNEWKKHPYIFFLLLVQKKTSLSRKKSEKKTKKFQKPKSCRQLL
jgi:hypothetical protein